MRPLICAAALLLAGLPLRAADEPRPNTLTPKEVADGWLLLFYGETTFGWAVDGDASVKDGNLVLGGDKATTATVTTSFGSAAVAFEYVDWTWTGPGEAKVSLTGVNEAGGVSAASWPIRPPSNGGKTSARISGSVSTGDNPLRSRFRVEVPAGARLSLRNVMLKPLELKSIFNGKDLTGWKKYEGDNQRNKSTFSVSDAGELCVKNGPGDLQTEGQWDDFVLQIECISNGKHVNSGVFFRCRPGEYQNGYEAQIHNGFDQDPPKDYTVEEFDPETHELKGKKTVKSAASDFGTGAIYRRVPARRAVAKDKEWFTMTVVAEGKHLSTWVNGIQQVDWTDNRPLKSNPREGCRLEKGSISLQGHDKTTDLCFRNIRIADLPPAEKK
jgi:hypothetical protein